MIGASQPLPAPNATAGHEDLAVATAYVESVYKAGGIQSRRIMLDALDETDSIRKEAAGSSLKLR